MSRPEPSPFSLKTPRIFSIASGRPFLTDLATTIHGQTEHDPLALSDWHIFLPTRRAMRALAANLIEKAQNKATVLPQIKAIGALDDDMLMLETDSTFDNTDIAPAISTLERKLVLARMIAKKNAAFSGEENWPTALGAANELAKLLDSLYTEEISFSDFDKLAPDDGALARHWQISRDFLTIVTDAWPTYLQEKGLMDPAERRIALIRKATEQWIAHPPAHPVIIAGSTGSTPAVASLMKAAAALPQGCVILPGLDRDLDDTAWDDIEDAHPQAGLKALLHALGTTRETVQPWPEVHTSDTMQARRNILSLALRPAGVTDDWLTRINNTPQEDLEEAVTGLRLLEAEDEESEAASVAVLIRETLHQPDQTIMLVTPDRDLTRRVSAKLKRWNIHTDDSAGVPFANTRCGTFLRLVAQWLSDISNPVFLLSVLRHPLCNVSTHKRSGKKVIAILDKGLRGLKPAPGIAGITTRLKLTLPEDQFNQLTPFFEWLSKVITPWLQNRQSNFASTLEAHLKVCEYLSRTDKSKDKQRLWQGEDGLAGTTLMASLKSCAHLIGHEGPDTYVEIFSQLMSGETVRQTRSTHPRIVILGPLEARLQTADHVILSGLNEGIWPDPAVIDGFLSRPMRATISLPSPERRTGLSAHDFAQLAASPHVTLTRAKRAGNAPATPSRWVVRLRNIFKGTNLLATVDRSAEINHYTEKLDRPGTHIQLSPPAPCPPVQARPRKLSVTRIEKWLRDPYFIYARYILGLRKLDQFNETFSARHVGTILHTAFENFTRARPRHSDSISEKEDLSMINRYLAAELQQIALPARLRALWHPAFAESLVWFVRWHRERLQEGKPVVIEEQGSWTLQGETHPFTVHAKADRIDLLTGADTSTGLAVYDYKTGRLPTARQGKSFNPQLTLTSLIAHHHGFENINSRTIIRQAYIKTLNRKSHTIAFEGEDIQLTEPPFLEADLEKARSALIDLIETFDRIETPYLSQPRPEYMDDYGDYDHLARRAEWAGEQDDDRGGTP